MFDPLRAPYAFELQALHHQEALLREAAHVRLQRALESSERRARRLEGLQAGGGRSAWGSWLVRLVGTQLVRWGYRLLPLSPPPGGAAPGAAAGARGRATPPPSPRERLGRRTCRRPPARLPRGLSLAGE